MKILFIGDVIGKPGRQILIDHLTHYRSKHKIDTVIANGENSAHGFGITPSIGKELFKSGVNIITTGNHVWSKREAEGYLNSEPNVIRPLNYPTTNNYPTAGAGYVIYVTPNVKLAVVNILGRSFMDQMDCPFQAIDSVLSDIRFETRNIIVDFHAETTSEKRAMGFFLNGRVSALIGTHTHIQTADDEILSKGTAYLTDVGMTGPSDSVIGVKKEDIIKRFLTRRPVKYTIASGQPIFCAAIINIDEKTGNAVSIKRIYDRL